MKGMVIGLFFLVTTTLSAQSTLTQLGSSTTDMLSSTLNNSFTLSSKTSYSLNKTVSATANTNWLIGCIENSTVKSKDCNPVKLGPDWEVLIGGDLSYSDTWKASTNLSTRSLQYDLGIDSLHTNSKLSGGMVDGWVSSLSDAHDTTQAIKANSRIATGYFIQWGSVADATKPYSLYYAQLSQSYFDVYQPGRNYNSTGITVSSKNRWDRGKSEFDVYTSTTFPFVQFMSRFQSAVEGKLSYWLNSSTSVTFQAGYNYYSVAPTGYNTNAVATSIGITWKPK
jgi:hypothetical protein